jgi:hypothetical protein
MWEAWGAVPSRREASARRTRRTSPNEVLVNFKFGKGTSKEKAKRDKMVKKFMDSLHEHLEGPNGPRFGKTFKAAKQSDVDVPETVTAGGFGMRDKDDHGVPGTYKYDPDAMKLVKRHGNDQDQLKITVIIVHKLVGPDPKGKIVGKTATAFSSTMETKNGDDLGSKEAILFDEDSLMKSGEGGDDGKSPAHETVHLGGVPDAPGEAYPGWGKLNSYADPRSDELTPKDEKKVKDYFDGKTREVKEWY